MIYSLGHSTHTIEDFIDTCHTANIDTIIDTRSHPGSKNHPQYNIENMTEWLPNANIDYQWWPELGGWTDKHAKFTKLYKQYDVDIALYCNNAFPKQRIAKSRTPTRPHDFTNWGFYDYSFYMTLPEFLKGIDKLIIAGQNKNIACICCEACWTRCHRSMIADYLTTSNITMTHITPRFRKIKQPRTVVNMQAHPIGDRLLRYHPDIINTWKQWDKTRQLQANHVKRFLTV